MRHRFLAFLVYHIDKEPHKLHTLQCMCPILFFTAHDSGSHLFSLHFSSLPFAFFPHQPPATSPPSAIPSPAPPYLHPIYRRHPSPHPSPPPLSLPPTRQIKGEALTTRMARLSQRRGGGGSEREAEQRCPRVRCGGRTQSGRDNEDPRQGRQPRASRRR